MNDATNRTGTLFYLITRRPPNYTGSPSSIAPRSPTDVITRLHKLQKKVICYFSAGTFEDWRPDADNFTDSLLGAKLPLWDGEWWVDIRKSGLRETMKWRLDMAARKGCDAVDPDNLGAFTRSPLAWWFSDRL